MSTRPMRPDAEELDEETKKVLAERESTFAEDKKTAEPWSKVKADLIHKLKIRKRVEA